MNLDRDDKEYFSMGRYDEEEDRDRDRMSLKRLQHILETDQAGLVVMMIPVSLMVKMAALLRTGVHGPIGFFLTHDMTSPDRVPMTDHDIRAFQQVCEIAVMPDVIKLLAAEESAYNKRVDQEAARMRRESN